MPPGLVVMQEYYSTSLILFYQRMTLDFRPVAALTHLRCIWETHARVSLDPGPTFIRLKREGVGKGLGSRLVYVGLAQARPNYTPVLSKTAWSAREGLALSSTNCSDRNFVFSSCIFFLVVKKFPANISGLMEAIGLNLSVTLIYTAVRRASVKS